MDPIADSEGPDWGGESLTHPPPRCPNRTMATVASMMPSTRMDMDIVPTDAGVVRRTFNADIDVDEQDPDMNVLNEDDGDGEDEAEAEAEAQEAAPDKKRKRGGDTTKKDKERKPRVKHVGPYRCQQRLMEIYPLMMKVLDGEITEKAFLWAVNTIMFETDSFPIEFARDPARQNFNSMLVAMTITIPKAITEGTAAMQAEKARIMEHITVPKPKRQQAPPGPTVTVAVAETTTATTAE